MGNAKKNESIRNMIRRTVRLADIEDNQILVIKRGSGLDSRRTFEYLMKHLARTGRGGCLGVIVNDLDDIDTLDEKAMNAHGWYRKDNVRPEDDAEENTSS